MTGFISKEKTTEIKEVRPFEYEAFLQELSSLQKRPPKQLFIAIFTHGSSGHGICDDSGEFKPIIKMKPILDALYNQGVQLGVYDASCYSGKSVMQLSSENYCVISAASSDQVGTGAITSVQAQSLAKEPSLFGKISLEDIWFSILSFSSKRLRQLPRISSWGKQNNFLAFDMYVDKNPGAVRFINENQKQLERVFAPEALAAAADLFAKGGPVWAVHTVVPGIYYLMDNPDKNTRICANFLF